MHEKGILDLRDLPSPEFDELWERIVIPDDIKAQLKAQVLLEMIIRTQVTSKAAIPLHGIILLVGPPGTGKTSIAKGVASSAIAALKGVKVKFIEVEPHILSSSALGKSQREIRRFLEDVVTEYAKQGPLIVLLDEVKINFFRMIGQAQLRICASLRWTPTIQPGVRAKKAAEIFFVANLCEIE